LRLAQAHKPRLFSSYSALIMRRTLFNAASPDFVSSFPAARAFASAVVNDTVTPLTTEGTILFSVLF
jgi:hypothetical protein